MQSVTGFEFARGNADVPANLLLQTGPGTPPVTDATALRNSDHDGGVLFILVEEDSDNDGFVNSLDNCIFVENPHQIDTNGDGYGNLCDPDLNNDTVVNFLDLSILTMVFFTDVNSPNWNPDADSNNDGVINFFDLFNMQALFFGPPGPSGLAP